jgi:hypothetical protein
MTPAVVVPAYRRPAALARLLASLAAAEVASGTPLVVAIDPPEDGQSAASDTRAAHAAVLETARGFHWPHGPKEVIIHAQHLGLVGNVNYCGGLATMFGAIVLLEDDLVVSARFFDYAQQALAAYGEDPRLAGVSLNTLWFNGFTGQPFIPMLDDGDAYFLQLSTPQGQMYTAAQWKAYADWLAINDPIATASDYVHPLFTTFPADDWLATKAKYLAATGRFYAYPRESLTTNFGEPGTHFVRPTARFQMPLQAHRRRFRLPVFDEALAVYDGFYELLPDRLNRLVDQLSNLSYDVDFYATKAPHQLRAPFTLTTRAGRRPLAMFGKEMRPLEANVIYNVSPRPGSSDAIRLLARADVDDSVAAARRARAANDWYFARYPGRRLAQLWRRIRNYE